MRFNHDPQAVLDYNWDWSAWLQSDESSISSYTLAISPDDGTLSIDSSFQAGAFVTAIISGGTLYATYEITCHIVSSTGREDDRVLTLYIRNQPSTTSALSACEWPVDYVGCGPCESLTSLPASGVNLFEDMAAEFLWRWTGQQFGLCEGVIRPCRQDCYEGLSTYGSRSGGRSPWQPTLIGGQWFNVGCGGGCGDKCGCSGGRALTFERPVSEVTRVEINGVVLNPAAYRVDNYHYLVRQDGGQWPYCQDMNKPLGDEDTWAVTVRVGAQVPQGGRIAAGKLACELAKAACGDARCELPSRVQSVTRQGVTVAMMLDTFDDLDKGKTGIWLIDSWVASVTKPDIGFSIASPDYRGSGRRTTYGG